MAHDPRFPHKFLVPETGTSNFARVPCILVPDFSGTRNFGGELWSCAVHLRSARPQHAVQILTEVPFP